MLAIRFNRVGKRNRAHFRLVAQEHTIAPGGRHVEVLGSYDPHRKKAVLKAERIKYWIEKGAQVSDSVWNLLIKEKIIKGAKRAVKMPAKKEKEGDNSAIAESKEIKEAEKTEEKVEEVKETKQEEKKDVADSKKEEKTEEKKEEKNS